jgi:hypothetical integral membrane protein (TIGR02206 family)
VVVASLAFTPYSPEHWGAIAAAVVATAIAIALGLRVRGTAREQPFRTVMVGLTALIWLTSTTLWSWPGNLDPSVSLPLHLCDLAGFVLPLAILTRHRVLCALVYFWGLGLSSQAFCTPTLEAPISDWRFWNFWVTHTAIVGGAFYLIIVERYRPRFRDVGIGVAAGLAYVAVVLPLNIAMDWNYGYVGRSDPSQPTIIDSLGAWPGRVALMIALTIVLMTVMVLPFEIARRLGGDSDRSAGPKDAAG